MAEILVVDDTQENLRVLSKILHDSGMKVRPFMNGRDALKSVEQSKPDLILLDIKMPDMNGYEVIQKLYEKEENKSIPVIFISALSDVEDKIKAFSCGGADYITKPFEVEEVLGRVNIHLKILNQQRDLENSIDKLKSANEEIIRQERYSASAELIFNIAHQWRQPLNTICLGVQDIIDRADTDPIVDESLKDNVQSTVSRIKDLSEMIDSYSKLFAPSDEKKEFNVLTAVDFVKELFGGSFLENNIEFEVYVDEDLTVTTYYDEFIKVLIKILSNSVDAVVNKRESGRKIIFSATSDGLGGINIEIRDNGVGIDKEILDKMFEPYTTTKFKSYEVGTSLFYCKTIIEKHMKGKIQAKNLEEGTQFLINLK